MYPLGDPEKARASIDSLEMPAGPDGLYLRLLQTKKHKPLKQGRTWPYVKKGDRVDDEDVTMKGASKKWGSVILQGKGSYIRSRANP